MIPLVELPKIVEHYSPHYESVFSPEALIEFQRYVNQSHLRLRESQPE
jgi:hypothetical protein